MSKAKLRAEAINRFVTDAKAQGVYDSLKAACILTGWDTLAGALTPLVGSAPTNNGFVAADYDRGGQGLKGNGSTKYLDSNRADNADGQNDRHRAVYASEPAPSGSGTAYIGEGNGLTLLYSRSSPPSLIGRLSCGTYTTFSSDPEVTGLLAGSRSNASTQDLRASGTTVSESVASTSTGGSTKTFVFAYTSGSPSSSRLSWYSIGSSVDLAALDTLVTRLMSDLRSIEEDGMDRDALAYCRAVEAQDGSFMVTGVKNAVDRLVKGLKYDKDSNGRSAWDAIGASCLLCGPRTIAGALVPLKGVAPTAQGGWTSSDYNQETGVKGNGSTLYLDTNVNVSSPYLNDVHLGAYVTADPGAAYKTVAGAYASAVPSSLHMSANTTSVVANVNNTLTISAADTDGVGFIGVSRSDSSFAKARAGGTTNVESDPSSGVSGLNAFVFARNNDGTPSASGVRLAFYSIGASLSLSSLDSRITKYVADVAAAIP